MDQGFGIRRGGEVIQFQIKEDVGDEERGARGALREADQGFRLEHHQGDPDAGANHREKRGKDAADAPLIEPENRDAPFSIMLLEKQSRDEIARDDEEDVHADEAAGDGGEAGMEENHRQNGYGAQPIYVVPVTHCPPR